MIQREGEQWKNIIEFPIYQISNFGNIRNTQREKELKLIVDNNGYYRVNLSRQDLKQRKLIHRLVCQYFNQNPNNYQFVDHFNGNRIDCRAENLRFCTKSQNQMNTKKCKNSTSNFKGVSFYQNLGKQCARIKINDKQIHLGYFTNEEEAGRTYDRQAIQHFSKANIYLQTFTKQVRLQKKTNFPLENYQQQNNQQ